MTNKKSKKSKRKSNTKLSKHTFFRELDSILFTEHKITPFGFTRTYKFNFTQTDRF